MSLKRKFIGYFLALALAGLTIGSYVIHQSFAASSILRDGENLAQIARMFETHVAAATHLPADSFLIFTKPPGQGLITIQNSDNIDITPLFSGDTLPSQAYFVRAGQIYTWASVTDPTGSQIIVLHKYNAQGFGQFLSEHTTEAILILFLGFWVVTWAALVISSLFEKIERQKSILEKQTQALELEHQNALEMIRAKSAFLAGMSHELRTPLSAIIGYAETLLHSDQPMAERLNSINTIIRNGNHMLTLVNDLLDLSKVEAGKLEVETIPIQLTGLLEDVQSLFSGVAKNKGLEFTLTYHFPLPAVIESDPVRLKQILLNLCSNAIKFTKSGYIHLSVSELANQRLQFQVEDSGIGMTPEQLTKLFSDYTQADISTSRKYGGTGLGLSLSKRLATLLGGDIVATSHPGRGSTFTLTIAPPGMDRAPRIDNLESVTGPVTAKPRTVIGQKLTGRVLLAEDNPDNQNLFSMYIRKFGIDLDIAHNGQQAIEQVLKNQYDLVFMDMQMPIMDGIEATESLRRKGIDLPIVALTANAMKDDQDRFFAAGCTDYLTKPVKREALYEACARYLQADELATDSTPIYSTILEEDPELFDIVTRFSQRLPAITSNLHALTQQARYKELAKEVHDLKGVGGNMGFKDISELAGKMEFQIANQNSSEILYLIGQLELLGSRIQSGLRKE